MTWRALYCEPRLEIKVRDRLIEQGLTAICPFERVRYQIKAKQRDIRMWRPDAERQMVRGVREVQEPFFRPYCFVETHDDTDLNQARHTRGVLQVVSVANNVLAIPDRQMTAILQLCGEKQREPVKDLARRSFTFKAKSDDQCVLRGHGPFAGHHVTIGDLSRLDDTGEVEVLLSLFGRQLTTWVAYDDIGTVKVLSQRAA